MVPGSSRVSSLALHKHISKIGFTLEPDVRRPGLVWRLDRPCRGHL